MSKHSSSAIIAAELLVFGVLYIFASQIINATGLTAFLPEMPIIKRAWVGFAVVLAILAWLTIRRADLRNYGLKSPSPIWRTLLLASAGIVVAIAVSTLSDPIIEGWFGETNTSAFVDVKGNLNIYLYLLPFIWLFAAFGEEFFYRGFLMSGIAHLLGGNKAGWAFALITQAVIFGLGHEYQGVSGMIGTGLYALVFGGLYLVAGRNLWVPALAHGGLDTLGFTLMYFGVIEA